MDIIIELNETNHIFSDRDMFTKFIKQNVSITYPIDNTIANKSCDIVKNYSKEVVIFYKEGIFMWARAEEWKAVLYMLRNIDIPSLTSIGYNYSGESKTVEYTNDNLDYYTIGLYFNYKNVFPGSKTRNTIP